MAEGYSKPQEAGNVGLNRASVTDALHDWAREIKLHSERANDDIRAQTLNSLRDVYCVPFHQWGIDDMVVFVVRSYPEYLLQELADRKKTSKFLEALLTVWAPKKILDWVCLLRRICTLGSFRLFVVTLHLNHYESAENLGPLAQALFVELPRLRSVLPPEYPQVDPNAHEVLPKDGLPFGEDLLESVVASFVNRPHDIACSRGHARDILRLTGSLGPAEVGTACRRLLMFLARSPSCRCDYPDPAKGGEEIPRMPECKCERNLEMDRRKEYARVLFYAIFNITGWQSDERAEFLVEACKRRFSLIVYNELVYCLDAIPEGQSEPILNPDVRPYSVQEKKDSYDRTDAAVQHAGCAEVRRAPRLLSCVSGVRADRL
jgi:hypothetical protein